MTTPPSHELTHAYGSAEDIPVLFSVSEQVERR
jgi:hypothetical protein